MIWFTSDHHFGHEAIIRHCRRPFRDVENMNTEMTWRWNVTVAPNDTVYYLGDFSLERPEEWGKIVYRLNGRKLLVPGNHDRVRVSKRGEKRASGFEVLGDNIIVTIEDRALWLNHYPSASDDPRHLLRPAPPGEYDVALCGHVHGAWTVNAGVVNVGVDVWDFRPISLAQILEALESGAENALSTPVNGC